MPTCTEASAPIARRPFLRAAAAATCTLLVAGTAHAQNDGYPNKPVKLMLAYATGGIADTLGRILANGMSKTLGQTVYVENRGGGGGTVGAASVAKAAPDGYTIMLTFPPMVAVAPMLLKSLSYDAEKDFTPIGGFATTPNILVVNKQLPVKTLKDLAAYAKGQGAGKLSFASAGPGSTGHLYGTILCQAMGIEMTHVPYKSSGLAFPDVISGRVSMVFDSVPSTLGHVKAGSVLPIVVMSENRAAVLPDVPTSAEEGYPAASMTYWIGLEGPAGMEPARVDRLYKAMRDAVALPETREQLAAAGAEVSPKPPAEFAAMRAQTITTLHKLVKDIGLQAD